jgi:uncharacterized protein YbjT (DUF2867 family)
MNVILFGASGMVGQGVLRECLLDPEISRIVSVVRSPTGTQNPKLQEIVHTNFTDFSAIAPQLTGLDSCFYCLGISSAGISEADYRRVTYDYTLAAARALVQSNPGMTFIYVSGAGTDSTEKGRVMWARVKGQTENALLHLPFKAAYMFRPGLIQPLHGIRSRTTLYRLLYALSRPLLPILLRLFPAHVTTTERLGRAMIKVARSGDSKPILEARDISRV